jgi:hypothetical protein
MQRWGQLMEVPVTTYRAGHRSRLFDFNGSSFEEICFVVTRALELGLPSITLLMHSWSLSDVREEPLLAKGFHYATSPALCEKLLRILDFLHGLPSLELSTLRETVARVPTEAVVPSFPTALFELDPAPFAVLAWQDGASVVGRCVLVEQPFSGSPEFAFYFMIRGERVATGAHSLEQVARAVDVVQLGGLHQGVEGGGDEGAGARARPVVIFPAHGRTSYAALGPVVVQRGQRIVDEEAFLQQSVVL